MKVIDVLWIEDDTEFVDGTLANFKEDRDELGFAIVPWHYTSKDDFDKNSHLELDALSIGLVCVDFNLPGGVNGNELIKQIRSHEPNKAIDIIFYSAAKNEKELQAIIGDTLEEEFQNIYFANKDSLEDQILNILG